MTGKRGRPPMGVVPIHVRIPADDLATGSAPQFDRLAGTDGAPDRDDLDEPNRPGSTWSQLSLDDLATGSAPQFDRLAGTDGAPDRDDLDEPNR